jgi:site-specific DNA-methyltransferase (adenine-specific)
MTDRSGDFRLIHGDSLKVLATLEANSVDAVVTDPPYELGFMGKSWDASGIAYNVNLWREVLRVLKPGGHMLAFSGSRTYHRMTVAIEDAGFEIRDQIMWVYGSGFPKSMDIAKAINKAAGVEFEAIPAAGVGFMNAEGRGGYSPTINQLKQVGEGTAEAKAWEGWGTALKPAHEPICLARKPIAEDSVADNVLTHGTGAINIDACRIEYLSQDDMNSATPQGKVTSKNTSSGNGAAAPDAGRDAERVEFERPELKGRFPANLIHDGSEEVLDNFPFTASGDGNVKRSSSKDGHGNTGAAFGAESRPAGTEMVSYGDEGSAARFFYCAKATGADRDDGLEEFDKVRSGSMDATLDASMLTGSGNERTTVRANHHPTVKPTELMRYLCRMVTPPGGLILDPFLGSGSTGRGAIMEGFRFVGVELSEEYLQIAEARIRRAASMPTLKPTTVYKPVPKVVDQLDLF